MQQGVLAQIVSCFEFDTFFSELEQLLDTKKPGQKAFRTQELLSLCLSLLLRNFDPAISEQLQFPFLSPKN